MIPSKPPTAKQKPLYLSAQEPYYNRFLQKIYAIIECGKYSNIITWGAQQSGVCIKNKILFERDILPEHFKHKKLSSFIRQLNMYNFKKKKARTTVAIEFINPQFRKDNKNKIHLIRRKKTKRRVKLRVQRRNQEIVELAEEQKHLKEVLEFKIPQISTVFELKIKELQQFNNHLQEYQEQIQNIRRENGLSNKLDLVMKLQKYVDAVFDSSINILSYHQTNPSIFSLLPLVAQQSNKITPLEKIQFSSSIRTTDFQIPQPPKPPNKQQQTSLLKFSQKPSLQADS